MFVYCSPRINPTSVPHLEGIWLSEGGRPSDPHSDPDVDHLCSDVAERQVADHRLLSLSGVCQTHVTAGGERCPCQLKGKKRYDAFELFYEWEVTYTVYT